MIRTIRLGMGLSEPEFALLFGVTMRTVRLWESGVVEPSLLTSMVIRAEVDKQRRIGRPSRTATTASPPATVPRLAARSSSIARRRRAI